jgi:hypothetical protein
VEENKSCFQIVLFSVHIQLDGTEIFRVHNFVVVGFFSFRNSNNNVSSELATNAGFVVIINPPVLERDGK